jgi:type IV pilus assembly protein PilB
VRDPGNRLLAEPVTGDSVPIEAPPPMNPFARKLAHGSVQKGEKRSGFDGAPAPENLQTESDTPPARAAAATGAGHDVPDKHREGPLAREREQPAGKKAVHDPFWLGTRLVEMKKLTASQLETAIAMYRAHPTEGFDSALERLSFGSQSQIARLIAERHGYVFVEISRHGIPPTLVRKLKQVRATHHSVVPYKEEAGRLTIAVADPPRYMLSDARQDFPGVEINFVVAAKGDILAAITDAYTSAAEDETPKQILDELVAEAAADDITDIHIEPKPHAVIIRRRRDGRLHYHGAYEPELKKGLVQAAKTMARLDIAAAALPMDGKARHEAGATSFNLRISTLPTGFGEKVVIRLQNETRNLRSMIDLGLSKEQIELLVAYAAKPDGIIFVTGPTGSGKTTLLYALLAVTAAVDESVTTIEDPIEYTVPSYTQCQVDADQGRTFAVLLRATLRQDPDIILVGETRDTETAQITIRAALTGHRVFSTLHTTSGPGAVPRLIDMGIEPQLVTGAVKAVVGTRLVRILCSCSVPMGEAKRAFTVSKYGPGEYREPKGCERCEQTGFKGRTLIAEIYPLDQDGTAELILAKTPIDRFTRHMEQYGTSMKVHGLQKAKAGVTTVEEILSAVSN